MPDMMKKPNGDIDFQKLFMGFALALVYVMQSYHAMQVSDLKTTVLPRVEYELKHQEVMDKDIILEAFRELNERIDGIENGND